MERAFELEDSLFHTRQQGDGIHDPKARQITEMYMHVNIYTAENQSESRAHNLGSAVEIS